MEEKVNKFKLFFDGAARNNPGPAGAGFYIEKNDNFLYSDGFYLGNQTNNQAEYSALIIGLFFVNKFISNKDVLKIISDSELVVRQILGAYKIKNIELKKMHAMAMSILKKMNYTIEHVTRDKNIKADKEANKAIDEKKSLGADFINFLKKNEVNLSIF